MPFASPVALAWLPFAWTWLSIASVSFLLSVSDLGWVAGLADESEFGLRLGHGGHRLGVPLVRLELVVGGVEELLRGGVDGVDRRGVFVPAGGAGGHHVGLLLLLVGQFACGVRGALGVALGPCPASLYLGSNDRTWETDWPRFSMAWVNSTAARFAAFGSTEARLANCSSRALMSLAAFLASEVKPGWMSWRGSESSTDSNRPDRSSSEPPEMVGDDLGRGEALADVLEVSA